jgi:hypothetical protein
LKHERLVVETTAHCRHELQSSLQWRERAEQSGQARGVSCDWGKEGFVDALYDCERGARARTAGRRDGDDVCARVFGVIAARE